jgi:hypothetical protein
VDRFDPPLSDHVPLTPITQEFQAYGRIVRQHDHHAVHQAPFVRDQEVATADVVE